MTQNVFCLKRLAYKKDQAECFAKMKWRVASLLISLFAIQGSRAFNFLKNEFKHVEAFAEKKLGISTGSPPSSDNSSSSPMNVASDPTNTKWTLSCSSGNGLVVVVSLHGNMFEVDSYQYANGVPVAHYKDSTDILKMISDAYAAAQSDIVTALKNVAPQLQSKCTQPSTSTSQQQAPQQTPQQPPSSQQQPPQQTPQQTPQFVDISANPVLAPGGVIFVSQSRASLGSQSSLSVNVTIQNPDELSFYLFATDPKTFVSFSGMQSASASNSPTTVTRSLGNKMEVKFTQPGQDQIIVNVSQPYSNLKYDGDLKFMIVVTKKGQASFPSSFPFSSENSPIQITDSSKGFLYKFEQKSATQSGLNGQNPYSIGQGSQFAPFADFSKPSDPSVSFYYSGGSSSGCSLSRSAVLKIYSAQWNGTPSVVENGSITGGSGNCCYHASAKAAQDPTAYLDNLGKAHKSKVA